MDWADDQQQAAFRSEVRAMLEEHTPEYYRARQARGLDNDWSADRKSDEDERREAAIAWGDALSERGWFAPQWPKEYGGRGG